MSDFTSKYFLIPHHLAYLLFLFSFPRLIYRLGSTGRETRGWFRIGFILSLCSHLVRWYWVLSQWCQFWLKKTRVSFILDSSVSLKTLAAYVCIMKSQNVLILFGKCCEMLSLRLKSRPTFNYPSNTLEGIVDRKLEWNLILCTALEPVVRGFSGNYLQAA